MKKNNETVDITTELILKFQKYQLHEVIIPNKDKNETLSIKGAKYLYKSINNHTKIAISCGKTISNTISQMHEKKSLFVEMFPLSVYPANNVKKTDSNSVVTLLGTKIYGDGTKAYFHSSYAPNLVDDDDIQIFEKYYRRAANNIFEKAKESDYFLFGIGEPDKSNKTVETFLRNANVTKEDLKEMGVIGEMNYHFYNKNGEFLILNNLKEKQQISLKNYYDQFTALKAEYIKEASNRRGTKLIAIASGKNKINAILSAIKGNLISTLITDFETANQLLKIKM